MKQILRVLRWVSVLGLIALCGCATVGSQRATRYRVTVQPVRFNGMKKPPKDLFLVYIEALARKAEGGYGVVAKSSKTVIGLGNVVEVQLSEEQRSTEEFKEAMLKSHDYVPESPDGESCSVVLTPKKDRLTCVATIRRDGKIVAEIEFDVDSQPVEMKAPDFRR